MKIYNLKLKDYATFSLCHHCRTFMDKKYLVCCTYKSSVLGFPVLT